MEVLRHAVHLDAEGLHVLVEGREDAVHAGVGRGIEVALPWSRPDGGVVLEGRSVRLRRQCLEVFRWTVTIISKSAEIERNL